MEYDPITKRVISGPVPTLKSFATRVLSSHISSLDDIGSTPYTLVAPFLAQCSAIQLGDIELRSPHIRKESRELWKRLTLSDFFEVRIPYEKREMTEPRNWRKVYIAAHEARQQKELDGKARLKDSYKALEEKREARKLVYDPRIKGEPKRKASSGESSGRLVPSFPSLVSSADSVLYVYASRLVIIIVIEILVKLHHLEDAREDERILPLVQAAHLASSTTTSTLLQASSLVLFPTP